MALAPSGLMNVAEAISARRAVRSYTSRPVVDGTVHDLLHAAVQAPSAMNAQPWAFAIVQNVDQLARWSERAKALLLERMSRDPKSARYRDMLREPGFNIFYDASTLIVIGVKEPGPYAAADCWLAAENLMLAACDAGLGTCCIGFAIPLLNTPDAKDQMALPEAGVAVAPIIVGYPRDVPPVVARNAPQIVSWSR
jgi:nitroreductase